MYPIYRMTQKLHLAIYIHYGEICVQYDSTAIIDVPNVSIASLLPDFARKLEKKEATNFLHERSSL